MFLRQFPHEEQFLRGAVPRHAGVHDLKTSREALVYQRLQPLCEHLLCAALFSECKGITQHQHFLGIAAVFCRILAAKAEIINMHRICIEAAGRFYRVISRDQRPAAYRVECRRVP